MHRGYLKLWRRSLETEVFSEGLSLWGFWCFLLLKVNYKKAWFCGIEIMPGQFATSYGSLADQTGASIKQLRTYLEKLTILNMIKRENRANRFTIITICHWLTYQQTEIQEGQTEGTTEGTTEGKLRANRGQQSKNLNNLENDKKERKLLSERTWESSFWLFRKNLIIAYRSLTNKIQTDDQYRRELQEAHPLIDLAASLKKAMTHFWATPTGWKWAKKNRKTETLNYTLSLINAIDKNRVYKNQKEDLKNMKPEERIAKW
jgi:hypothetical protein